MPPSTKPTRARAHKSLIPPRATRREIKELYDALIRSEAQLRATLYSIGDAVIATDAQGRVAMMNPVAERLTGWREDDARGKSLAEVFRIINEITRAPAENPVARILREGTVIGLANHTLLLARDGREIPIADAGAPIFDARRKIVGVVLVFRDQTAERAAQRAVRDAREFAENILATMHDPLIVLDAHLRVVSANRAFYRVFATTPAETEGRLLYDLGNRQWDIPELRQLLEAILPQNTSFDDYRVTHAFERVGTRTMLLNARRVHRQDGKTELILLAIQDITARQNAEDALRASEERFRRLAENAPDLIYRYELAPQRGFTYVSPSAATITGYTPEEHYADPDLGLKLAHPEDRPLLEQYLQGDGTFREPLVLRWTRKDGRIIWAEQRNVPIFDAQGNLIALEGIARDVTERGRRERALQAQARIAHALGETQELQPLLERLIAAAIHAIPAAEKGSVALCADADHLQVRALYGYRDAAVLGFTYPITWGYAGRAARERRPLLIADAQTDDALRMDAQRASNLEVQALRSAIAVPLRVGESIIGVLSLESAQPHVFDEHDLRVLTNIAATAALVIERARLFEETQRRAEKIAAVNALGRALAATLDVPTLCRTAYQHIRTLVAYDNLGITLYDADTRTLRPAFIISEGVELDAAPLPPLTLEPHTPRTGRAQAILDAQTVVINDLAGQARSNGKILIGSETEPQSAAYTPMLVEGKVIGLLELQSYRDHAYSNDDLDLLSMLANQIGLAIQNARLFAETRARLNEVQTLATVSAALSAASTRAEMFAAILDQLMTQLDVDGAAVEMLDPESGDLLTELGRGVWAPVTGVRIPRGKGLSAHVLATGKPYWSNDARGDPRLFRPDLFGECRAMAGAPLRVQTQTLGLLWIGSRRALTDDDARVLTAIADIAASAIHRAALNDQTERQVRRLSVLRAIDRVISSSFDVRLTLGILLEHTAFELGVDAVSVLAYQPHTHTLEHAASRGFRTRAIEQTRLRVGQSFAGRVALERQIVHIPDLAARANGFIVKELAAEGYVEYYGVPLIAKGNVVGVMELFNRAPFPRDSEWREFCETLAGQAAIAIDHARLFEDLQRSNWDLVRAYDATIEGWSRALELRDKETEGHSERVTQMTLQLARTFGIEEAELAHVRRGALLHDIGKIAIPDAVLQKPSALTDAEWELMREHPQRAYEMLLPIAYLRPALDIPYCHHERWDGTGYPRGLKGEEIPLVARLFAVADVYDALTSDRPYRKAWARADALAYIREQAGKQFDPRVVEMFLAITQDEGL